MKPLSDCPEETREPPPDLETAVAVLTPRGRDSQVAGRVLHGAGIAAVTVASLDELAQLVEARIGAVLMTEEALHGLGSETLRQALAAQPAWSDLPFVVLANGAGSRSQDATRRIDDLGNAVLLSRPLHAEELVRSLRSALRARRRQHEARRRLAELQLRERQLFESEAKFQAIANFVDQMIWSTRADGHHDYYNHRWYEFTGIPEGSTDGAAWNGMLHPQDQEMAWKRWRDSLATGEPYEIEYRLRHRSGEYRWVLGRAQPLRDQDGTILRWYGTCTDIHEIKIADEQRQLMLGEMNHRVKNTLAMVSVMVSQTLRQAESLSDARTSIQSRISMMAQAHDRLINATWSNTGLVEVIEAALAPHRSGEGHFSITGPDVPIGSKQALALTMALHELSTNASKYGALSTPEGRVNIAWSVAHAEGQETFEFSWIERDGPAVEKPTRLGFGSRMIEHALAGYFGGKAQLDFDISGLRFSLTAPLQGLTL